MKTIVVIFLLLVTSVVSFGQEHKERAAPTPRPVVRARDVDLYPLRYSSPEGRYSVRLPAQPKLSTQQISAPDGSPVTQYMAMVADGEGMLMIAYFDYSGDVVFNLDKARDGMAKAINGTVLDEHSMSLGGAPGRQVRMAARTDQGLEFIDRARFYDVKGRVFVLQCLIPKSLDGPPIAVRCEQFFDSFQVRTTP